jgi:general transcription factor 3C polypeptide 5 (transcription factor C subunit 1)
MHPAPGTIRVTTDAGVTRLINGGRYKVRTVQSILHVQRQVPTGPEPVLLTELGRDELSPLEQKMHNLLQERPCWTRTALLNQLSADDHKVINAYVVCVFFAVACVLSPASWELTRIRVGRNKSCWPMISYTFADGPFRDLVIRYGYDPRTDPEARLCAPLSPFAL